MKQITGLILVMLLSITVTQTVQADDIPCTEDALRAAITANGIDDITLPDDCTITLTQDLPPITKTLEIDGNGAVIDGNGDFRPFHIQDGGEVILDELMIVNASSALGGAMYVSGGSLVIDDLTASNNTAIGDFGGGALLISGGDVTITGSNFHANRAFGFGGALAIYGGTLDITNSTISDNLAFSGGGLSAFGGEITLTSTTFTANQAEEAGGAITLSTEATMTIEQSIVAGNSAPDGADVSQEGGLISEGYNLFGSTDFVTPFDFADTDLVDNSPELAGDVGFIYPLTPFSLALDAVPENACAIDDDQLGTDRPQGDGCDIGAIEMEQTGDTLEANDREYPELVEIAPMTDMADCTFGVTAGVVSSATPENVFCRVLMRDEAWVANPGSVPQSIIDRGVIVAVEVFSMEGGDSISNLENPLPVCLNGRGRIFFLDAMETPRTERELSATTIGNYTCAFIPDPGTVALVYRFRD